MLRLAKLKQWFSHASREALTEQGRPVATPPPGSAPETEQETPTSLQTQGINDKP